MMTLMPLLGTQWLAIQVPIAGWLVHTTPAHFHKHSSNIGMALHGHGCRRRMSRRPVTTDGRPLSARPGTTAEQLVITGPAVRRKLSLSTGMAQTGQSSAHQMPAATVTTT